MKKVFISTSTFGQADSGPLEKLEKAGLEYALNPFQKTLMTDQLIRLLKDTPFLIAGTEKITKDVFKQCPQLKVISRCGTGVDNIDLNAAAHHQVKIASVPDVATQSVAELAIGLMLDCLRSISRSDRAVRAGYWPKLMGNLLHQKTLGIIGFGRIGQRVANLLEPFSVKVLACDPAMEKKGPFKNVSFESLDKVLMSSDIITIHLPYHKSTHHLIDTAKLQLLRKDAIIINTSRGGIIDEGALTKFLELGNIRAAGLDVFEVEPYTGELLEIENVVLCPHIGSYTKECRVEMEYQAVNNLLNFLNAHG